MDRAEARKRLEANRGAFVFKETNEALDLAIEALQEPEAKGVDFNKEWLIEEIARRDTTDGTVKVFSGREVNEIILNAPSVTPTDCNDCIWNTCNYNKIDWESSEDCISRQAMRNFILENYRRLGLTDSAMTELSNEVKSLPPVTPTERTGWIPVSERLPEDLDEVNVTWVNHNPPVYYEHIMGKPYTGFAVRYGEEWYWWDSTIVDTLAEYGNQDFLEPIDKGIEIIAWMPLPEPYKGGDTE